MSNSVLLDAALGGDGKTYTDAVGDNDVTNRGMDGGNHAKWFIPLISALMGVALYVKNQAIAAANSALSAVNSPGTSATSTTNTVPMGLGSKTITIQTGKALQNGMWLSWSDSAAPAKWIAGAITNYTSGTGSVTINAVASSGDVTTPAGWNVSLIAPMDIALSTRVTALEAADKKLKIKELTMNKELF